AVGGIKIVHPGFTDSRIDTQDRGFCPGSPGRFCSCRLAAVVHLKGTSEKRVQHRSLCSQRGAGEKQPLLCSCGSLFLSDNPKRTGSLSIFITVDVGTINASLGHICHTAMCLTAAGERQPLTDKNKSDPGNLGNSLDPVYQSLNP
ncbi:hypothetical protein T265_15067, partial [Opisthorchis viverrini]